MSSLLSYIKKVSSHGDNSRGDASPYEEDCCGLHELEEWNNYSKSLSIDALLKLSFIHLHLRTRIRTLKTRLQKHLVQCTTEMNSAVLSARNEQQLI